MVFQGYHFNNLLTVILGNIEMALDCGDKEMMHRYLADSKAASLKAARIGEQLLLYLGGVPLALVIVDCCVQIKRIMDEIGGHIPSRVRFGVQCDGPIPVACDLERLKDAVACLVDNSVEAMPPAGGEILVTVGPGRPAEERAFWPMGRPPRPEEMCRITVRDNGAGIPPDDLSKIFDPFFSSKMMGRGLGLSTVLGVIKLHDGAVGVESVPGEGTAVHLFLPMARRSGSADFSEPALDR